MVAEYIMHILLMEEILHHLGCIKPWKSWDTLPINWCRISSINSRSLGAGRVFGDLRDCCCGFTWGQ